MWYGSLMPANRPTEDIEFAEAAVAYAQQVRAYHRRRTERGSKARESDIEVALDRLRAAMKPLRTHIGKFAYGPQTTVAEDNRQAIRAASEAIQIERRKLWKLQKHRKREK